MKFKVGDRVTVTKRHGDVYNDAQPVGTEGVIEHSLGYGSRDGEQHMMLYQVGHLWSRKGYSLVFSGNQLTLNVLDELAKL